MSRTSRIRSLVYLFVIACLLAGFPGAHARAVDTSRNLPPGYEPQVIDPDPVVQTIIDQVDTDQLWHYDEQMAGHEPVWVDGDWYTITDRFTYGYEYGNDGIEKTTHWMYEHLNNLGIPAAYHVWDNDTNPNVIGEIEGLTNPEDIYIIGGHIDTYQTPGADDDGSGSVATMVAANILSQFQWDCTIRFAFWTGEEQWMLGSSAYSDMIYAQGENVLGYLNLDMLAWNTLGSEPEFDLWYEPSVPGSHEMALLFEEVVGAYGLNLVPHLVEDRGRGGDHESFWAHNYPSIMVIEDYYLDDYGNLGDFNPYYHGPGDIPENMDFEYFTNYTKAALATFVHMTGCMITDGLGALDGTVTDAGTGEPIADMEVSIEDTHGHTFPAITDASGYYTRTLTTGVYTLTADTYGYLPQTVTGVPIFTDTLTTVDFELEPADSYMVSGYVREMNSGLPLDATVQFADAPVAPVQTDPATGYYSIEVAEGTWTLEVEADGYAPASAVVEVYGGDVEQDFDLYPYCSLFTDDIEDGNTVWTAESPWAITELYAHSPTHSWTDSPSGNYGNNIDVTLTSAPWDLSEYSGVSLNFWHRYETEEGYDYASVEYSVDGGDTWSQVMNWDGTQTSWTEVELALPQLDGQAEAQVRFRLTSDVYVQDDGWYVDDIVLSGGGPVCAPPAAPKADFSSNSPVFLGQAVEFENETIGTEPISYEWDFGDGSGTSVEENPVYTYAAIGEYTVTLTATNELGVSVAEGVVEVVATPDIAVDPAAITVTLGLSMTGEAVLEIGNLGPGELTLSGVVEDVGWLTIPVTLPVTVAPGDHLALKAVVDTTGLAAGTYTTILGIQSNDPDEGEVIIPVTLVVQEANPYILYLTGVFQDLDIP